ncbi:MAG: tyrosine-type recombinase/integrase [Thiotrichales bacterium]
MADNSPNPPQKLFLAAQRFNTYLQAAGKAPTTREHYLKVLAKWAAHVSDLYQPTKTELHQYLGVRLKQVSRSTLNGEITALRQFYRFAKQMGYSRAALDTWFPKQRRPPQRLPKTLSVQQIDALLAIPDRQQFNGLRDYVIMRLIYETGMVASQLVRITVDRVHLHDLWIVVPPLRANQLARDLPMSEGLAQAMALYLVKRAHLKPGNQRALFLTRDKRPFRSGRAVWALVKRYSDRMNHKKPIGFAGLVQASTKASPQKLRNSCAQQLLESGMDLRHIQYLLGHASLRTTTRFEKINVTTLKEAHALLFPPGEARQNPPSKGETP